MKKIRPFLIYVCYLLATTFIAASIAFSIVLMSFIPLLLFIIPGHFFGYLAGKLEDSL